MPVSPAGTLDRLLEAVTDYVYAFDLDGRFTFVNRPLLDLWGLSLDEAVGRDFFDLGYPPDLAAKLRDQIGRVIRTKVRVVDETHYTSPTGVRGDYQYIFSPVLAAHGSVEAVAGTTRDISELRQAERDREQARDAQRESDERYRTLFESTNDGCCIIEKVETADGEPSDYRYVEANPAFAVHAGVEGVVGSTIRQTFPTVSEQWYTTYDAVLRTGEPVQFALHLKSEDHVLELYACRMKDPSRRRVAVIFRDITERRRAEAVRESLFAAERAARAEAERAGRMKDEFLATLSHEIRTPLNAILGWSHIMRTPAGPEDIDAGLEVIERNARAQSQIIDDLLDMSRIVSGKIRLDVRPVDLSAVVRAAVDTARPAAEAKGVTLRFDAGPPGAAFARGDANRLQQVLWNLLTNAVKFTPAGGRVGVTLGRAGGHLEVGVTDTGEGIGPEFLPHVFDRFRQADASTTRRHGGLGLGLSIVKQLVELHGGSVRAASGGPGRGATFVVALPASATDPAAAIAASAGGGGDAGPEAAAGAPRPPAAFPDPHCDIAGVRVLVVDDEPDARALVKRLLEDRRAVVTATGCVPDAVALVETGRFDVLVSDIGMPGEDGYALLRRVRSLGPGRGGDIPAVALTAYARPEDRVSAVAAGFRTHVPKPVEPAELVTMVAGAAGRTNPAAARPAPG